MQYKPLIINLFGAPGAGKTTTMHLLTGGLSSNGYIVEAAEEWIKDSVFDGSPYPFINQALSFVHQHKKITTRASAGVEAVITDSPLLLQVFYSYKNKEAQAAHLMKLYELYDSKYDNINIHISSEASRYIKVGRRETPEEALRIEQELLKFYIERNVAVANIYMPQNLKNDIKEVLDERRQATYGGAML